MIQEHVLKSELVKLINKHDMNLRSMEIFVNFGEGGEIQWKSNALMKTQSNFIFHMLI